MKKILRITRNVLVGLIIVVAIVLVAKWTYISRLATYPLKTEITEVDWYLPKETVKGNYIAPLPLADPDSTRIDPAALQTAVEYAGANETVSLLALHRGEIVLEEYWQDHHSEAQTNSMSMAKTLVSLALGIAIEEGFIPSEEVPAANYLSEWEDDERAKITIKHLLHMSSGLRLYDDSSDPFSDLLRMYADTDAAGVALSIPAVRAPGQDYEYNNANSVLLALILQRATGRRLAEYISEKIWQPIGAKDAAYWLDADGGDVKPFCCFFTRGRDWLRLGEMLMDGGKVGERTVIPEHWLKKMLVANPYEPDYGYQIWLGFSDNGRRKIHRSEPLVAKDMFYLDGRAIQRVYIIPSHDLVIVRTGRFKGDFWDDSFIPNALVRGLQKNNQ